MAFTRYDDTNRVITTQLVATSSPPRVPDAWLFRLWDTCDKDTGSRPETHARVIIHDFVWYRSLETQLAVSVYASKLGFELNIH